MTEVKTHNIALKKNRIVDEITKVQKHNMFFVTDRTIDEWQKLT